MLRTMLGREALELIGDFVMEDCERRNWPPAASGNFVADNE